MDPEVSWERIESHVYRTVERVEKAGEERIIFISGAARLRPDNWSRDQTMDQLNNILNLTADHCERYGIILCIEPLNITETNMIDRIISKKNDNLQFT
ncbi:MAG: hypothetical protein JSV25_13415 [Spirochaetota bacterium]|nr:MAG: hypothetical protein JSV25_13415 [Spirochaetota bacterium]